MSVFSHLSFVLLLLSCTGVYSGGTGVKQKIPLICLILDFKKIHKIYPPPKFCGPYQKNLNPQPKQPSD